MEVILREHVDTSGAAATSSRSPPGYARNYLLPRKLALAVTDNNKRQIEREKKLAEARDAGREVARPKRSRRGSAQLEIEIARRVGENDTLYGSVTSADIAQALKDKGFEIDKRKIQLADPLKALGEIGGPGQDPSRRHRAGAGEGRRRESVNCDRVNSSDR